MAVLPATRRIAASRGALLLLAAALCACAAPPVTLPGVSTPVVVAPPLENTRWRLDTLGGRPVQSRPAGAEPYITLESRDRRLVGSTGCNRLIGGYELDGDRLAFPNAGTTMMACVDAKDEYGFVDMLGSVRHWRKSGSQLSLLDARGTTLAQFVPAGR